MKMNPLGRTGMTVSELCLGTMTFGNQTAPEDGHAQIERALDAGINFMDTAEMYPVNPVRAETIGRTEEILGDWFAKTGRRNEWILASKHTGDSKMVRDGAPISGETIPAAIEGSLKRLKTDTIDLYQFHWPNRGSYHFRQNWSFDPSGQDRAQTVQHMHDALGALQREVERGTIRAFGLSNESTWGTMMWLKIAEETGGPRVASIQNEYSLVCRLADTDLAEMMCNEDVGLLPFSPLGAGLLTGKYQGGAVPEGSRMALNGNLGGRKSERVFPAVDAYLEVAQRFGIDPVHMALAWSLRRPFVASSIFGATTMAQLEHLLGAVDVTLSDELLEALDETHKAHPLPY
ncbi:aldo/keto reductase [Salipiger bermudensis]|uniref:Oxidoreductase, aldo/keto reductase family protein n=1 Tax=Salipiger bermudensis (strain DSM 26914 / JCM 13377 / KCTC 12554 / HTCC2601) TaxID=314265 RepID=Q0FK13_SALBH|nr:aldo/keto reductase [Salipiger bermudensis]EAU44513.1 oxidoreductase, aldo/keto reductase family protein [Salipiger bermudensis HTCC2601]